MKEEFQIPRDRHSYKVHRRQFWVQIFLPMILAVLLIIAVAVITSLTAFGPNDNSPIWAAVSAIWLVIPVMFFGLIFLAVLLGLIYLLARTLQVLPPFASKAQGYLYQGTSKAKDFSNMLVKPVFFIEGIKASLNEIFNRD